MNEAVREMTFEEEYEILGKEAKELFEYEIGNCEPHFSNCIIRRALRCIRKLKKEKDEELQQYRSIGTVEECRDAVERQMAKKPIKINWGVYDFSIGYECPRCRENIDEGDHHCRCGQVISWEESEGEDD